MVFVLLLLPGCGSSISGDSSGDDNTVSYEPLCQELNAVPLYNQHICVFSLLPLSNNSPSRISASFFVRTPFLIRTCFSTKYLSILKTGLPFHKRYLIAITNGSPQPS